MDDIQQLDDVWVLKLHQQRDLSVMLRGGKGGFDLVFRRRTNEW
jgi:hypothetical protein